MSSDLTEKRLREARDEANRWHAETIARDQRIEALEGQLAAWSDKYAETQAREYAAHDKAAEADARAERLRVAIVAFVTYADQQPNRRIGSGAGGQTIEATLRASGRLVSDWHIGQLEEALNEPIEDKQ